jgi:hypothetical protein
VILLDVARRAGENTAVALLRGASGQLERRTPDQDPHGVYKLVAESAKAGESQGQPVIVPEEAPKPRRGPQEQVPSTPRETPPGTGGGGGAGGG